MARLTDEELQVAIAEGQKHIDEMTANSSLFTPNERELLSIVKEMAKAMIEYACEIQALRQQNADMAAWINAQCGGAA